MMQNSYEFNGVLYKLGIAGSLILRCPNCEEVHCREPENYFWSLVPENAAWLATGQKNYWGAPEWHKCFNCKQQMEPIQVGIL